MLFKRGQTKDLMRFKSKKRLKTNQISMWNFMIDFKLKSEEEYEVLKYAREVKLRAKKDC
ncbi:CLUMA_CG005902, isoform A [Clunio marinus]|uniref:CLUMA_CG005902, isoform A n=1 Tax=Clunio marinus TaxID=568069 RepID=A0A1J1HW84_9DIPT|nr:CLUMA_CG005902, isoform A [Clunio marinus]